MSDHQHILNQIKQLRASGSPSSNSERDMEAVRRSIEQFFNQRPELCQLIPVTYQRQMTARQVIRKGDRDHHVGMFASRLNQALIPFESALEKHACTTFESYPEVQAYRSQPYAVRLHYAGKTRTVYPDFEITSTVKKILVDIRYERQTHRYLFRQRCEALKFYAEQRGMAYTLMTEKTVRGQRLLNAQWLLSLSIGKATPNLTSAVWGWIHNLDQTTFGDLFHLTAPYPQVRCVLACLALDGHLVFDWDQPLREQLVRTVIDAEL